MKDTNITTIDAEVKEDRCPTCTRSKYDPFRGYDITGKINMGCIDDYHTGHLTPISQSSAWHNRKEAKGWRQAVTKHKKLITGRAIHDYRTCKCFGR